MSQFINYSCAVLLIALFTSLNAKRGEHSHPVLLGQPSCVPTQGSGLSGSTSAVAEFYGWLLNPSRNSRMALPSAAPVPLNFPGPKITNTITKIMSNSGIPISGTDSVLSPYSGHGATIQFFHQMGQGDKSLETVKIRAVFSYSILILGQKVTVTS